MAALQTVAMESRQEGGVQEHTTGAQKTRLDVARCFLRFCSGAAVSLLLLLLFRVWLASRAATAARGCRVWLSSTDRQAGLGVGMQ